jgi:hypothetical protein
MQDQQLEGSIIRPDFTPINLPRELAEAILASDVTILITSDDGAEQALTVQTVYALGLPQPERIASHAYANAVRDSHDDLLRTVRGEPTDAQRYLAFREFACMEKSDPARFSQIDAMLVRFERAHLEEADKGTPDYMDKIAGFLVHALLETASPVVQQQPRAN